MLQESYCKDKALIIPQKKQYLTVELFKKQFSLFDQMAYDKYRTGNWKAMLRNKLRIRMKNEDLDEDIEEIFSKNKQVAKEFYKLEREELIKAMSSDGLEDIPKSMDNIVFVANELYVKNEEISNLMPNDIRKILKEFMQTMA